MSTVLAVRPAEPERIDQLISALRCKRPECRCRAARKQSHLLHCPAHDDREACLELKVEKGELVFKCSAGCKPDDILNALRRQGLWEGRATPPERPVTSYAGCTIDKLVSKFNLWPDDLREVGLRDTVYQGVPAVEIPYHDEKGNVVAVRYQLAPEGDGSHLRWREGDEPMLYGLVNLWVHPDQRHYLLVESEVDCWTIWQEGYCALAVPTPGMWRAEWDDKLLGLELSIWVSHDTEEMVTRPGFSHYKVYVLENQPWQTVTEFMLEAEQNREDGRKLLHDLWEAQVPVKDFLRMEEIINEKSIRERAEPVENAPDPLQLVADEIKRLGYGGEIRPALIVYLAATSRLLKLRAGSMAVHVILIGPPSAGKSWTIRSVLQLLPENAYHVIDAGSDRVFIYDPEPLKHRVLVFGEADSLPTSEDNTAASALRNLLQDNYLHYDVVERSAETGSSQVRVIEKKARRFC